MRFGWIRPMAAPVLVGPYLNTPTDGLGSDVGCFSGSRLRPRRYRPLARGLADSIRTMASAIQGHATSRALASLWSQGERGHRCPAPDRDSFHPFIGGGGGRRPPNHPGRRGTPG